MENQYLRTVLDAVSKGADELKRLNETLDEFCNDLPNVEGIDSKKAVFLSSFAMSTITNSQKALNSIIKFIKEEQNG